MGWNGSGGYTRAENFSADSSAGIKILATRMDTEFNDFASAMTLARARDGQNSPTANLPMAGYRHTNVGAAASAEDYMRVKEFIRDVPIYVKDHAAADNKVQVSVGYYASVSAGQSPPDGSRLRVLVSANSSYLGKATVSVNLHLYTPLNTSAGAAPHIAPIWTRGRKFDAGALKPDQVYDFVYDASASGWQCINPSRSYWSPSGAKIKARDNNGTLAGTASASGAVSFSRHGAELVFVNLFQASVSCSISAQYLIFSVNGATTLTSGIISKHSVPITVKDVVSHSWMVGLYASPGQIAAAAAFNTAGTTVSAACTIRVSPFTAIFLAQGP